MSVDPLKDLGELASTARLESFLRGEVERSCRRGALRAESEARRRLAAVMLRTKRFERAMGELHRALEINRQRGDWRGAADLLFTMAEFFLDSGRPESCEAMLSRSRQLYGMTSDVSGLALTELLQADVHVRRGDRGAAEASFELALEGFVKLGAPELAGRAFLGLFALRAADADGRLADAALKGAAASFAQGRDPVGAARCRLVLARRLQRRPEGRERALAVLDGLTHRLGSGNEELAASVGLEHGNLLAACGRLSDAERRLRTALRDLNASASPSPQIEAALMEGLGGVVADLHGPEGRGEVELLLARSVDLYMSLQEIPGVVRTALRLVEYARVIEDSELGRRWARRATRAAEFLSRP